jgi:hypothetical protein
MEPHLHIALGPPTVASHRAFFDKYQETPTDYNIEDRPDWLEMERKCLEVLFNGYGDFPPSFAHYLSEIYGRKVEVDFPFIAIGLIRGLQVVSMCICANDVRFSDGGRVPWPPNEEDTEKIARFFGLLLKREWVEHMKVG